MEEFFNECFIFNIFSWLFKIITMYRNFRRPHLLLHRLPYSLPLSYKSLRTVERGYYRAAAGQVPSAPRAATLPSLPWRPQQRPICHCIQIRLSILLT